MKKLIATSLAIMMLLSMAVVLIVPAAAVDGQWTVYGPASQYADGYDGDPKSVAGYEYTDDGLHQIPADWTGQTPWAHIQTKEKVDLKDGVYFQVRIDNFSYEAADQWFNINIWDSAMIEPPVEGYGEGVQTLIRATDGNLTKVNNYHIRNFTGTSGVMMVDEKNQKTEDGKNVITLTVTWDGSTYAVDINGAVAPEAVITYMNEKWGGNDSEAYIGICAQNSVTGGTVEMTVTKFGTSADNATVPMGEDSQDVQNNSAENAPIADASTVPANQPAILMNGNKEASALKSDPKPANDVSLTINEDYSLHVAAHQENVDTGTWYVKNEISYAIEDFPIGIILMRNFCTCGSEDGTCYANESVDVRMLTGDTIVAGSQCTIYELNMCDNAYVIGDDTYLYFYFDMTTDASFEATGRINGARYYANGIDVSTPGANEFDVLYMAWFRSVEEAEAYVQNTIKDLGWVEETETVTSESVEETTVETEETTVEAEETTVETNKTEQTTEPNADETDKADVGGCGSVVGFGAIAIVAVATVAGMVSFKKKED